MIFIMESNAKESTITTVYSAKCIVICTGRVMFGVINAFYAGGREESRTYCFGVYVYAVNAIYKVAGITFEENCVLRPEDVFV
jgi:hypothetical protein